MILSIDVDSNNNAQIRDNIPAIKHSNPVRNIGSICGLTTSINTIWNAKNTAHISVRISPNSKCISLSKAIKNDPNNAIIIKIKILC